MSSTISCGFCATTLAAALASTALLPHPAAPVQAALRRAEGRSSGAREAWLPAGALRDAWRGADAKMPFILLSARRCRHSDSAAHALSWRGESRPVEKAQWSINETDDIFERSAMISQTKQITLVNAVITRRREAWKSRCWSS